MACTAKVPTARSIKARARILSGRTHTPLNRARARPADPESRERQSRAGVYEACRHPHHEPGELLILQWGQTPLGREGPLARIPEVARDRQQDAEDAGVERGHEQ